VPTSIATLVVSLEVTLGGVQLWYWLQGRDQRALAHWTAAHMIGALGVLLVAGRGHIADSLSIGAAQALLIFSFGLIHTGAQWFGGRRASLAPPIIAALGWLAALQIDALDQSLAARVALVSLIGAVFAGLAAAEFRRPGPGDALASRRPLILMLSLTAAGLLLRAALVPLLDVPEDATGLPAMGWFYIITIAVLMTRAATSVLLISLSMEAQEARARAAMAHKRDLADQANLRKSRFLTRMSHELRTPLNGVLGMAQVLADDPALDDDQRARVSVITQAGRHLLGIVNDLLDLERVETGRIELAPEPVDLRRLLSDATALMGVQAAARGQLLSIDLDAGLPDVVLADPQRLRQAVLNLLGNAVKFTPERGSVTLSARAENGLVRIAITDTGPGVADDLRDRLFQDYARGAEASAIEGSGLGLAITSALAVAMGGEVTWAPGPGGEGSVFTLSLPLPLAQLSLASAPTAAPSPLRVLLVDDVAANRRVLEALLTHEGHTVEHAASGPDALLMLKRSPVPDLVLLDLDMPGMDGFATTAHIRRMAAPASGVTIIAVTGHAHPTEVRACLAAGMDGHLSKPVDRQALRHLLTHLRRPREGRAAPTSLNRMGVLG